MTLRYQSWELDLIVAFSALCLLVSLALVWASLRVTAQLNRKHLIGAEREFVNLPIAGAQFRLLQQLAFSAFAVILWVLLHPGLYPLLVFYLVAQGSIPFHSLLLLRAQRRANRKIPPAKPPATGG